jgi:tetratricopeptide (TPR) repeat protein
LNPASAPSRPLVRAAAIALLAATVSLLRFTPAFVLWRGLGIPAAAPDPALNRAADILGQLRHPLAFAASPNNRVIEWRLLFPVLGHALALPGWLYLALPHLGCLLVLTLVACLFLRHGAGTLEAFAATTLVATCSWFFVSMAWLGYFDSWYILALVAVVFAPRRVMLAAILLAPWVDERFVLTLPLCLLLRDHCLAATEPVRSPGERWGEAGAAALALLPWILTRGGAQLVHRDAVSGAYLQAMTPGANAPFYLSGLWQGLRWAWVPVLAGLAIVWRAGGRTFALLLLGLLLTLAVNLLAANDLSRSASVLVPAVVAGVVLFGLRQPRRLRPLLLSACALNLLFPAEHVVGSWTEEIHPLTVELEHARHPPPALDPDYYTHAAAALNDGGDPRRAIELLDIALQLDPGDAAAYVNRAVSYYKLGRLNEARADADQAVQLRPGFFEALYNRAIIRAGTGDFHGAGDDLAAALRVAPAGWPGRSAAAALLASWRARPVTP